MRGVRELWIGNMAKHGEGSMSGSKGKIEDLMKELALNEEKDMVFNEKDAPAEEDLRWMILVRVHMDKDFSNYWFFRNMRTTWDLARPVKIKTLEENLFVMQFKLPWRLGEGHPRRPVALEGQSGGHSSL